MAGEGGQGGELCITKIGDAAGVEGSFPGRLPKDELRVCIAPSAYEAMQAHAKSSLEAEVCGVMLGKLERDGGGPFLTISDAIQGEAAKSEAARVTFTPETWTAIHAEQERRSPELKMVGWYHTHPRFGIFLSEYDQFIHRNFFGVEPWMVALVIDPVKDEEGIFGWHRGEIVRFTRHWVGAQPRRSDGAEFDGRQLKDDHAVAQSAAAGAAAVAPGAVAPGAVAPGAVAPGAVAPLLVDEGPQDESQSWLLMGILGVLTLLCLVGGFLLTSLAGQVTRLERNQGAIYARSADLATAIRELRRDLGLEPSKLLERIQGEQSEGREAPAKTPAETPVKTPVKTPAEAPPSKDPATGEPK